MKIFLLAGVILMAGWIESTFCQCPQPGLKIQTPDCERAKDLKVIAITSSALQVKWQGNKNQAYIIKTSYFDPSTNNTFETETLQSSCDNGGRCFATIPLKEGMKVTWGVQSVCVNGQATVYSITGDGEQVETSGREPLPGKTTTKIRAYPNPTTGYLTVEYIGKSPNNIIFRIFDMTGKMVFSKSDPSRKTNSNYKLDLRGLTRGAYLLEASCGGKKDRVKVVLFSY